MNKVTATGVLVRTGKGERGYAEMTLMVKRKSDKKPAFIKFVLDTILNPKIQLKDVVTVDGFIRGYQYMDEKGVWRTEQYFVATKVDIAKGEMEEVFGVKDHFPPKYDFKFYIEGTVRSVRQASEDWKSLLVALKGSKEVPDIIKMTVKNNIRFSNNNEYHEVRKGDEIVARLSVWTPQNKKKKGEIVRYEDLIIEDFAITNRTLPTVNSKKEKEESSETQSMEAQLSDQDSFEETEE